MIVGLLAYTGGIPTPKGRLGKAFFAVYVCITLAQVLQSFMALASFCAAWASFSSEHANCLMEWKHGHSYFTMVVYVTFWAHPQNLVYAFVFLLNLSVLVQARRLWCVINLRSDTGSFWVLFPSISCCVL